MGIADSENEDNFIILTGLSTGQMIEQLKVEDVVDSDQHIVIRKVGTGEIIIVENGQEPTTIGQELVLNATVMSATWTIYRPMVSFYEAMKAHKEQEKTITYHHSEDLTYTFKHELETGQFNQLSNDNLCLYELIEDKWTIDD